MRLIGRSRRLLSCGLAAAGILGVASPALALVKRQGTWPEAEAKVTLDVSRTPRDEAIRKLAEAAGWSVVVHAPQADLVDIHVKDQPAGKVLDLLLLDADYVATRDGTLVSIRRTKAEAADDRRKDDEPGDDAPRDDAPRDDEPGAKGNPLAVPAVPAIPDVPALADLPDPPEPPDPPGPPEPRHARGRDRTVTGESLKIAKNETVKDVSVMGGSLNVYGQVTGDIDVTGGSVHIHKGARVFGDVSAMGGNIQVDDGGRIDGEVEVVGGSLKRGEGAIIGGDTHGSGHGHSAMRGRDDDDDDDEDDDDRGRGSHGSPERYVEGVAAKVGSAFARAALLFVFGTILLALRPERMETLKVELVARPMRSFAMGVVGMLGAAAMFALLCVTVIGIPFAVIGAIAAFFALSASMCAVLETVGRALTSHKSKNPYLHLAVGCGLFLGVGAIPVVGGIVIAVVMLLAAGMLVSTRGAGLITYKKNGGAAPYRTSAA